MSKVNQVLCMLCVCGCVYMCVWDRTRGEAPFDNCKVPCEREAHDERMVLVLVLKGTLKQRLYLFIIVLLQEGPSGALLCCMAITMLRFETEFWWLLTRPIAKFGSCDFWPCDCVCWLCDCDCALCVKMLVTSKCVVSILTKSFRTKWPSTHAPYLQPAPASAPRHLTSPSDKGASGCGRHKAEADLVRDPQDAAHTVCCAVGGCPAEWGKNMFSAKKHKNVFWWTNLRNKGLISADRSATSTLLLTIPRSLFKSSAKDLSSPISEIMIRKLPHSTSAARMCPPNMIPGIHRHAYL